MLGSPRDLGTLSFTRSRAHTLVMRVEHWSLHIGVSGGRLGRGCVDYLGLLEGKQTGDRVREGYDD